MSRVIVLGAGYAGVHAARTARRAGADVVLVDPAARHALLPRYAAVAGGRAAPGDTGAELGPLLDGVEVVRDRAVAVTPRTGPGPATGAPVQVELATGGVVTGDTAVVTVGAAPALPDLAGLAEYAHQLASEDAVLQLRELLVGAASARLVVLGGGATGVQLAAEVAHTLDVDVELVEQADRILPGEPRGLARGAARILHATGVTVRTGRRVVEVDTEGAVLDDGTRAEGTVVWAGGWRARGSTLLPGAGTRDGRLVVADDLTVPDHPGVLAAGDVAAHADVLGRPLPMSAQVASRAGDLAGRNAVAIARGDQPRRARLVELGRVLDLGGGGVAARTRVGVARIGPLTLARRPLDRVVPALHLAIDLRHLWQVGGLEAVVRHAPGRGRPSGERGPLPTPGSRGAGSPTTGDHGTVEVSCT